MKIRLNEIPEEGREYTLDQNSAELNSALSDLIGKNPYDVKIFIKALNNRDYTVTGQVKTNTIEQCSMCGIDFNFSVNKKLNDFLIPKQDNSDRTGRYAKSTHTSEAEDDGPDMVEYDGQTFDLGEYVHEAIALEVPFNPKPLLKENGDCSICQKPCGQKPFSYDEKLGDDKVKNPFHALKGLKL